MQLKFIMKLGFVAILATIGEGITNSAIAQKLETIPESIWGAWVQSKEQCDQLFVKDKKGWAFRRGIDQISGAAIIDPKRISSLSQTCTVLRITKKEKHLTINLECRNQVSFSSVRAELDILNDSTIVYGFNSDKDLNESYIKCDSSP